MQQAERQPAKLGFLNDLKYTGLTGNTMQLTVVSRARIGFIRGRVDKLAEWLSQLAQRTVRIELIEPDDLPDAPAPTQQHGLSQQEKMQAMNMPLTRQVAELFDATLIDLRDDQTNDASNDP